MKKIISIICTVVFLFSLLGFTALAENSNITISEDYKTIYADGYTYSRFNVSMLDVWFSEPEDNVVLSETQKENIDMVSLRCNDYNNVIEATFHYKDGSHLEATFLRDDYHEQYAELLKDNSLNSEIDFEWPEDNIVEAKVNELFGTVVTLDEEVLAQSDTFEVTVSNKDESLKIHKGWILSFDGDFYYVDFEESDLDRDMRYEFWTREGVVVHEIDEDALVQKLTKAQEAYWDDGLGFFENGDFTEMVSLIFIIFVFAVVPMVVLILFIILAIRAKSIYKKMFRATYILCGAELAVFATLLIILQRI